MSGSLPVTSIPVGDNSSRALIPYAVRLDSSSCRRRCLRAIRTMPLRSRSDGIISTPAEAGRPSQAEVTGKGQGMPGLNERSFCRICSFI